MDYSDKDISKSEICIHSLVSIPKGIRMSTLAVEVIEIKGHCPVFQKGDTFLILEGYKLQSDKEICMHSLSSIMPYYVALSRGISPKSLGLSKDNNAAYVQCLDPCDYTDGGTVIFKITRQVEKK